MKFLLFLLVSFIIQLNANKILVLIDDVATRETHSMFLDSLKARGHTLSIRFADDSTLSLFKFGKRIFDDVFILAPSVHKFGGAINAGQINNFVDDGGNLLVTGSSNIGDAIREIAIEFGFEYDLAKTAVVDHFNYDSILDDGHHTTIVVNKDQMIKSRLIAGDVDKNGPLLYKGVGLLSHKENNLVLEVVNGYSTSYSYNPSSKTGKPSIAGKDLVLVGGVQSRNNARAVFTGSLEMFSNDYFTSSAQSASGGKGQISGNKNFVIELSKWILQENGVLRVASVKHNVVGESEAPEMYTIMDDIEYKIKVEEKKDGKWVPFTPSDLQLEFVRVDPFIRKTLTKKGDVLWTKFKCPNVNGIYKFKVDYHRKGYSHLTNIITVPVRPFTHTQYERFIRTAYPYYAGAFSMMGGFVIFCIFFLYSKEAAPVTVEKKTN